MSGGRCAESAGDHAWRRVFQGWNRIGYGAGYYDRFFAAEPDHMAVGLCYGFQLFPAFETEKHDKKMAYIVTPEQTIKVL